jgi:hypothetical protein
MSNVPRAFTLAEALSQLEAAEARCQLNKGILKSWQDRALAAEAQRKLFKEALRQIGLVAHSLGGNTQAIKLYDISKRCDRVIADVEKEQK